MATSNLSEERHTLDLMVLAPTFVYVIQAIFLLMPKRLEFDITFFI